MKILLNVALAAAALTLSGCPITGGAKYTVGGTVTGLNGSGFGAAAQRRRPLELQWQRYF